MLSQDNKEFILQSSIPPEVKRILRDNKFDSLYVVNYRLNPFYLRGDFNNDGVIDIALSIRNKSNSKEGFAIIHPNLKQMFICGAGQKFNKYGDDFNWIDLWMVVPTKYHCEGIEVQKTETSSGILYWSGKKYLWLQGGD